MTFNLSLKLKIIFKIDKKNNTFSLQVLETDKSNPFFVNKIFTKVDFQYFILLNTKRKALY